MREPTRYYLKEIIEPFEFEKIIPEILFNLDRDPRFKNRRYPDIRKIGGVRDRGHDAISIIWENQKPKYKEVFAFSKRIDWKKKFKEDIINISNDNSNKRFVFVTTEVAGINKLPESLLEYNKQFNIEVEIIDIDDLVLWLDNTDWGKEIKEKYCIEVEKIPNKMKILWVDDELKSGLFNMAVPLLRDGHEVDMATDMDKALKKLEAKQYDFIILDLHIPREDYSEIEIEWLLGFELLKIMVEIYNYKLKQILIFTVLRAEWYTNLLTEKYDINVLSKSMVPSGENFKQIVYYAYQKGQIFK